MAWSEIGSVDLPPGLPGSWGYRIQNFLGAEVVALNVFQLGERMTLISRYTAEEGWAFDLLRGWRPPFENRFELTEVFCAYTIRLIGN